MAANRARHQKHGNPHMAANPAGRVSELAAHFTTCGCTVLASISPLCGVFGVMAAQLTNYTSVERERDWRSLFVSDGRSLQPFVVYGTVALLGNLTRRPKRPENLQMEPFLCIEVLCAWPAGFFWFPGPAQTLRQAGPNTGNRQTHIWLQAAAPLQGIPRPRHCGMPGQAPETVKATCGCQPLPVYRERPPGPDNVATPKTGNPTNGCKPRPVYREPPLAQTLRRQHPERASPHVGANCPGSTHVMGSTGIPEADSTPQCEPGQLHPQREEDRQLGGQH